MTKTDLFKTYKDVFDSSTISSIWYLITHKRIEGLESPIKVGKESNVFTALTKENKRVAIKIYRISTCDFFKMSKYLAMDTRFRQPGRRKQVVLTWAKREFSNLLRAYKAGVNVPRPIVLKDNVLIMEFIGDEHPNSPRPANLIKDEDFTDEEAKLLIHEINKLHKAGLVHGDLSEFNVLSKEGKPVVIDLSHAVPILSPAANDLLERDVDNLYRFFNKKKVKYTRSEIMDQIIN